MRLLYRLLCTAALTAAAATVCALRTNALQCPSAEDIRLFYRLHPWSPELVNPPAFAQEPTLSPYTAGALTTETQTEALNCLNLIRYAAGLPADVQLSAALSEKAQASTVLFWALGRAAHSDLPQPADMDDAFYALAAEGAMRGNLSWDTRRSMSLIYGIASLNLTDWDDGNIARVGHRRWMLSPKMQYAGFGRADIYTCVYVGDKSRSSRVDYDYIAFPPAHMPYLLYTMRPRFPFSVSLGAAYEAADPETLTVDITSQKRGETMHLDHTNRTLHPYDPAQTLPQEDWFLTAENAQRGTNNTVIFNPGLLFDKDDVLEIRIGGLRLKSGAETSITYQVDFFDLIQPAVRGDANCDGRAGIADAVLLETGSVLTRQGSENADLDGSGTVNPDDLAALYRLLLSLA